ncbi:MULTISPECIES: DUF3561 family protein [Pantoea]|jgi:dolichyl-phosphate-mannose--protein O-mannosyl transferase|uniref:DUF3561 family protein n=1 Tax=Pantoea TaxID=53335 RepID=UPI0002587D46|nr:MULTISPECIES: DUF3561 family protein [Pantoea]TPE14016.1 DUF3561 family protein [Pantoea vagans]EIB96933.1 hypothetical protein S7A_00410 [Pantoea sp. Sc1]KAA5968312.1 DUF3561 family protein [Pantoea sp. M_6]KAA5971299.1 DUF3561 family protein [Pantoea sp. M_8]KAA5989014.1 DUF3561 family protein [Pantoea sp. M_10]
MQNITPLLARKDDTAPDEPRSLLPGCVIGFLAYWCALAIPFLLFGSNTLFFFLYTWPFFLALLPVAVVAGIALNTLLSGQWLWTALATVILVVSLFWLMFSFLSGW